VNNELIRYENYDSADVQGVEFEFRKNLDDWAEFTRELSFGFNITYIQSEVARTSAQYQNQLLYVGESSRTRPMFDQPEYILNSDLTWDHKSTGTAITLSAGVVGRRLTVVGLATPDEYEEPTPQLDVFLAQSIGKHWKLKLSAKNLLNPAYETTQDWVSQVVKVRSYTKGMTFGLSLGCEF
jgi:outer membrane receptor for ferrienterochelin and colicin